MALSICAAYREEPDECEVAWRIATFNLPPEFEGLVTPHNIDDLYEQSKREQKLSEAESLFSTGWVYLVAAIVIAVNLGVIFFIRHRMKKQIRSQMNSSVNAAVN